MTKFEKSTAIALKEKERNKVILQTHYGHQKPTDFKCSPFCKVSQRKALVLNFLPHLKDTITHPLNDIQVPFQNLRETTEPKLHCSGESYYWNEDVRKPMQQKTFITENSLVFSQISSPARLTSQLQKQLRWHKGGSCSKMRISKE